MSSYRLYIYAVALLPYLYWAIVVSNPWVIIGLGYKLNRAQRCLYARYRAWKHARKVFHSTWETYAKHDRYSREAFKLLKKREWEAFYQRKLTQYLIEAEKHKHPLELEYEERQRYGL